MSAIAIDEPLVQQVVLDISSRMKDPNYTQVAVGDFVQSQPHLAQYLSAKLRSVADGEAVMVAAFHGSLLRECFRRALGTPELRVIDFPSLDRVATRVSAEGASDAPAEGLLANENKALADYLTSNVDEAEIRESLALVALALGSD